jgi:hypothetical protein
MLAAVGLLDAAKEAAKQPQHQKKKHLIWFYWQIR